MRSSRIVCGATIIASIAVAEGRFAPTASATQDRTVAVLRLNLQGGFGGINAMDPYSQPIAVLDSGGQLFRPASGTQEPRPTLAPYTVVNLSKSTRTKIEVLAKAAGLSKKVNAGTPPTADARDLVVSFNGNTNVIASYGFGDEALPPAQLATRKKLRTLISYLNTLPAGTAATPASVVVTSFNYANHNPDPSGLHKPQPPKKWPSEYAPLDGSCVILDGPKAIAAIKSLEQSNVLTPWTSDGNVWRIVARPALPGDRGCNAG
jgi:hypothetical protein